MEKKEKIIVFFIEWNRNSCTKGEKHNPVLFLSHIEDSIKLMLSFTTAAMNVNS